jgi:integrase
MTAARAGCDARDRLVVELLAHTGMRAGELADLDADAVVRIGAGHWPRIRRLAHNGQPRHANG